MEVPEARLTCITEPSFISHIVGGVDQQRIGRVDLQRLVRVVLCPVLPGHRKSGGRGRSVWGTRNTHLIS